MRNPKHTKPPNTFDLQSEYRLKNYCNYMYIKIFAEVIHVQNAFMSYFLAYKPYNKYCTYGLITNNILILIDLYI